MTVFSTPFSHKVAKFFEIFETPFSNLPIDVDGEGDEF